MKTLFAVALLAATPAFAAPEPVITGTRLDISATGSVDRAPDVATIGAGVVTQSSSASSALADNAKRMTATIATLKRAGVADRDIQTASLSLQPQYRYADNQPPVLTGYQASNRVSVRLRDLAKAGSVIDALVASGANQLDGPSFGVDKPEAALDEARIQALATAKARADLYAKAAGLHVKRIVQIAENDVSTPVIRPMAMMAKRDATPMAAGEQTLAVNLAVTFELE
ncbi:SIMPL domain-containing protein [Sphingomonas sp. MMS24-J13]|uniref:SIMPL domain-containing protein n=1 Tax=Sphingomonas sp. MMS24-J13 TaxID=3238686 RepID=UPI00384C2FDC